MTETEKIDLSKLKIDREEGRTSVTLTQKRGTFGLYAAGVVIVCLVIFFFLRNSFGREEVVELTSAAMVSSAQANALLTASGYVVAQRKAAIASKATGRLVSLDFVEGDRVRKGQIIARIESADVEAALTQARANLEVVKAERNDANSSLERAKSLIAQKLISQADLDAAQWRYDRVAASIDAADAGMKAAEVQVENTLIRAPFDGTILEKNADVGEVVAPFGAGASSKVAVVTIADMSSLEVEADVSESNIEKIVINQPCEIVLDAYPDRQYRGNVDKIVPTADRAKATVLTKIKFADRDARVLPEMSAKVHFLSIDSKEQLQTKAKLIVDNAAIGTRDGKKVVFVFKDYTVSEVPVQTGETFGSRVEILSGISAGDKVVLKPSDNLRSGSKVKLKE